MKGIQIRNKEVKLSLFADDMILYKENPKCSTKKLLELINEFSKGTGYKIIIQKSVAIFMPLILREIQKTKREIKKTIPFTITLKRLKYLGINLTKK